MKEKYKKSEFGDAILVDDGTDWNLVAALYGYNGSVEQDAPGVAERAALFVAAPNLLERAEVAEARAAALEARIIELQARIDMLELEVIKQHHIASACAEAEA